ncbi:MAG: hypothetical protein QF535_17530 [Anaerolineales bacterium]|nr:hypothetical protein [Anaerolineales bacterium]
MADIAKLYKLDSGTGATLETLTVSRKTGWFSVAPLDKNVVIRRMNARYSSPTETVKIKVYADGDSTTAVGGPYSLTTADKINSFRVGKRAKVLMVEAYTDSASSDNSGLEINKLEVEIDAV